MPSSELSRDGFYRLRMNGPQSERFILYNPHQSRLFWEDTLEPVSLSYVGMGYPQTPKKEWRQAFAVTPDNPARKTKSLRNLKIQLGLSCNYSCKYCNQGGQPNRIQGKIDDVAVFLEKLPTWFDGGSDGKGAGVKIEFWGGEPLVYFKILRPLAEALRVLYPNAKFNIISNCSLLTEEIVDWYDRVGFSVGMSHDGPGYATARGEDPLDNPEKLRVIKMLFERLAPKGRFGFNCVLTRHHYSLKEVRDFLAAKLDIPPEAVPLSTEEILLPYDDGGLSMSPQSPEEHERILQRTFWDAVTGSSMPTSTLREKCEDFFRSIAEARPSSSLGQKCGMDRPDSMAVNMKGDVITCQNTSASTKHKIGSIEAFEDIRLTTATHWSKREECGKCPVVQFCRGACFYTEGKYWTQSCDNSFTWNLSVLATALYYLTRMVLSEIEGPVLRRPSLPNKIKVINMDEAQRRARPATPTHEVRA